MKSQSLKIGIFIAILGIASIIISQTADFSYIKRVSERSPYGKGWPNEYHNYSFYNTELKNGLLYGGIAVLIIGAGIAVFSSSEQKKL